LVKSLGLEQKTIVFFASDNGPSAEKLHNIDFFDSNGPLRGKKRTLYEGGIRVPLIVRCPGRVPSGRTTDVVHGFQDFQPTCAELAGLSKPANTDGISMVAALEGRAANEAHAALYWDYGHVRENYQQAVRMGNWKGVRPVKHGPVELYGMNHDVSESQNVAGEHPEILQQIENLLRTIPVPHADYLLK
jgi:arylsulfatase A-like enzyme